MVWRWLCCTLLVMSCYDTDTPYFQGPLVKCYWPAVIIMARRVKLQCQVSYSALCNGYVSWTLLTLESLLSQPLSLCIYFAYDADVEGIGSWWGQWGPYNLYANAEKQHRLKLHWLILLNLDVLLFSMHRFIFQLNAVLLTNLFSVCDGHRGFWFYFHFPIFGWIFKKKSLYFYCSSCWK